MRALRIILITVVVLGGLFVAADRIAVNIAESKAADRIKATEGLTNDPSVSIEGFPFLTQVASGSLDDVKIGIKDYEASSTGTTTASGTDSILIDDLTADMKGVSFNGDYSSATAASASGTATVSYAQLLKAAKSEPTEVASGVTAQVVSLSDGGDGKIKVGVKATLFGKTLAQPVYVLATTTVVDGNTVRVKADTAPNLGVELASSTLRQVTDFQQKIDDLPGGVSLDTVQAAKDGVEISVKGSDVKLVG
ncbi:Protein of unknown function DUF2993 [Actinobacteria bacterium OK074]|nr:Protein of unknown function DUF2993 [Actinobacteria bacterium OK074]